MLKIKSKEKVCHQERVVKTKFTFLYKTVKIHLEYMYYTGILNFTKYFLAVQVTFVFQS